MKMVKIDVSGMSSEKSVNEINAVLLKIDGVKTADAVLKENAVYIIFNDNHVDIENIKNNIEKLGYTPGLHITWTIS